MTSEYVGNNQFTYQSLEERFWDKVEIKSEEECWEWKGFISPKGYGRFKLGVNMPNAQRVSWMLTHGKIPNKLHVLHSCDNRSCVNPKHLYLGTNADNMRDMAERGRSTKGKIFHWGENHWNTTLSSQQIKEIRLLYSTGDYTYAKLAKLYRVCFQHIGSIVTKKVRKYDG